MERLNILDEGIYFRQIDYRIEGYQTLSSKGLVHNEYKKPTTWSRVKFFAKYGRELDFEPIATVFFYFNHNTDKVYSEYTSGDAITIAKSIKNDRKFLNGSVYTINGNIVEFEANHCTYKLIFSEDWLQVDEYCYSKRFDEDYGVKKYNFLNWNNI